MYPGFLKDLKKEQKIEQGKLDPAEALSHIFHVKEFSSDHQMQMVRNAESIIESHNIGLIIVDVFRLSSHRSLKAFAWVFSPQFRVETS